MSSQRTEMNSRSVCAMAVVAWCVMGSVLPGMAGEITWLYPNTNTLYDIETSIVNPAIDVTIIHDFNYATISTWQQMRDLGGFLFSPEFHMWESKDAQPKQQQVIVCVSGLPPGVHKVYMQFFKRCSPDGDAGYYIPWRMYYGSSYTNLTKIGFEALNELRMIDGVGGLDMNNVYDGLLGVVGTVTSPTTNLAVGFERTPWAPLSRFGTIRIETE